MNNKLITALTLYISLYAPLKNDFSGSSYDRLVCDDNGGGGSSGSGSTRSCCENQSNLSLQKTDLLSFNFNYLLPTDKLNLTTSNTGAITQADGALVLSTGTHKSGSALVTSKYKAHSNASKTVEVTFSAAFTAGKADSVQWAGIGDTKDGFFIGYNGTTFSVVHRLSGTDTIVAQSSFNKDTLDGSGSSTITINPTKYNIFKIKYIWLAGPIAFQIMKPDGEFSTFHQVQRANQQTVAALENVHLPFYAEAKNANNETDLKVQATLWNALLCGQLIPTRFYDHTVENKRIDNCNAKPILTIKNKTTINSTINKGMISISSFGTASEVDRLMRFKLIKNATLTGASFASKDSYSISELDTSATAYSGGEVLFSSNSVRSDIVTDSLNKNRHNIELNPGDTITVVGITSAGKSDVDVNIGWEEYF